MKTTNHLKYLLFDFNAITHLVSNSRFQSIEYDQGKIFIAHCCGKRESELLEDIYAYHDHDGILFIGKQVENSSCKDELRIFCIDLIACGLLNNSDDHEINITETDYLTLLQKTFRTTLKIWNAQAFTLSERVNGSKVVVFPYVKPDHRRIVIERENNLERLRKRKISYPLLAYKFSSNNTGEDIVDRIILQKAGEAYVNNRIALLGLFPAPNQTTHASMINALTQITGQPLENSRNDFIYRGYDAQFELLTASQREIVNYKEIASPLRIDGAAGTGKTMSLIMRAYRLLEEKKSEDRSFNIIFFTHSISSCEQTKKAFGNYPNGAYFMECNSKQHIEIVTLLDYCSKKIKISGTMLLDTDAGDAKNSQLMLIGDVLKSAHDEHVINTYLPVLSSEMHSLFQDLDSPNFENICSLLHHEFSIQIKGRTDCTLENYMELPPIHNGLACKTEPDKELVFRLFTEYQQLLKTYQYFDVDDIVLEMLSRLNAPIWRRKRMDEGYDYIIVDEMHLFNINEQSIFHYLTKDYTKSQIPICFALDYSQAIGDRGDTSLDYIEKAFGITEKRNYHTVFRNSPQITEFCASIAAAGTLMFHNTFRNPYESAQSGFTNQEEKKSKVPQLFMLNNDTSMISKLSQVLDELTRTLQCRKHSIGIITFDTKMASTGGAEELSRKTSKPIEYIDDSISGNDSFILASPYDINGLEFDAVVMLAVDEGHVPQTIGTSDISQHFLRYSAYNMLYLSASRAKFRLIILGSKINGRSSCLDHSIEAGYLEEER